MTLAACPGRGPPQTMPGPRDGEVWRPRVESLGTYVETKMQRNRCPDLGREWMVPRTRRVRRRITAPARVIIAGWQTCRMLDDAGQPFTISTETISKDWVRVGARHLLVLA